MKIWYCECGDRVEILKNVVTECKCGKLFGVGGKISNYINMRNTPLGNTTKMEISYKSMDESVQKMRNNK